MSLVNAPTALCKGGGDRPSGNSVGVLLGFQVRNIFNHSKTVGGLRAGLQMKVILPGSFTR